MVGRGEIDQVPGEDVCYRFILEANVEEAGGLLDRDRLESYFRAAARGGS